MKKSVKYLVILAGIVAVSFSAILIRFSEAPPLTLATYRLGISAFLVLPFFLANRSFKDYKKKDLRLFLFTSLFLALHFFVWITSLRYTSIMNSTVLVTLNPIFVAIFLYLFFKTIPTKYTVGGILLALMGSLVLYLASPSSLESLKGSMPLLGNTLALLGAVFASLYFISTSVMRERYSLLSFIFPIYFLTFIFLLFFSIITRTELLGFNSREYLIFFLFALIPHIIGHTSFNWALKYFSPTFIALVILGEPVGATILGILLFREVPSTLAVLGAILIISAIAVSNLSNTFRGDEKAVISDKL